MLNIFSKFDDYLHSHIFSKPTIKNTPIVPASKRKNHLTGRDVLVVQYTNYEHTSFDKGCRNEFVIRKHLEQLKRANKIVDYIDNIIIKVTIPGQSRYNTLQLDFLILTDSGLIILETKYRNTNYLRDIHMEDASFQLNRGAFLFSRYYCKKSKNKIKESYAGYMILFNNFDMDTCENKNIINTVNKFNHLNPCTLSDFESNMESLNNRIILSKSHLSASQREEVYLMDSNIFSLVKSSVIKMDNESPFQFRKDMEEHHITHNGGKLDYRDQVCIKNQKIIGLSEANNQKGIFKIKIQRNQQGHLQPRIRTEA